MPEAGFSGLLNALSYECPNLLERLEFGPLALVTVVRWRGLVSDSEQGFDGGVDGAKMVFELAQLSLHSHLLFLEGVTSGGAQGLVLAGPVLWSDP